MLVTFDVHILMLLMQTQKYIRFVITFFYLDVCQWSEWSDEACSNTKCGPQHYTRRRHSLVNEEYCKPMIEKALCPLKNCVGK